jgi:outer membrane immunogenic protein
MKKMLTGAALLMLAGAAQPVLAADLEPIATPGPWTAAPAFSAVRVYNWTGFYVGLTGGGAFGGANWTSVPDVTSGSLSATGGLFGGTLGYNLQTGGPFVLGIETDIAASSVKATVPAATCVFNCQFTSPWLATARLRFGYAFNDILPYVTVGASITRLNASTNGVGSERANNLSWVAGFGVEFVLVGPLTGKVEYLYADLGGLTCNLACNGPVSANVHENIVRAGLNYRFARN